MKYKIAFISNSSSSSFVIKNSFLTADQIEKISNHIEVANQLGMRAEKTDRWTIDTSYDVSGFTFMDNFDMREFLKRIGVCADCQVQWGTETWDSYNQHTCYHCHQRNSDDASHFIQILLDRSLSAVSKCNLQDLKEKIEQELRGRDD